MKQSVWAVAAALALVAGGCGGGTGDKGTAPNQEGNPPPAEKKKDPAPVTLKLYNYGALNDTLFQQLFVEPVKQKYPHITLEMIYLKNMPIAELAVGGNEMDIVTGWGSLLDQFANYKLLEDMTPYLSKHGIDLNKFESTNLKGVQLQSDTIQKGGLYGLPFGYNFYATFYNKSIFDKFGVAYPPDGMTWNDAYELGKKLTRKEGETQYKGLDPEGIEKVANALSLPYVDPQTFKATLQTDGWRNVFELVKKIHDIPGNDFVLTSHGATVNRFVKDRNVAMLAAPEVLQSMEHVDFEWDIAEYPSFPERPHTSGMAQTFVLQLASNSKHKEEAMQVIQLATSAEVQMALSKTGVFLSGLNDPDIQKQFGAENSLLKGKHIDAILKTKPAPYVVQTRFTKVRGMLEAQYKEYVAGKIDVNTALRTAEEQANQYIAAERN